MDNDEAAKALSGLLHDLLLETYMELTNSTETVSLAQIGVLADESKATKSAGRNNGGTNGKGTRKGSETVDEQKEVDVPSVTYIHPKAPGAKVMVFSDNTVIIRDAHGKVSDRKKHALSDFEDKGWIPEISSKPKAK